MDTDAHGFFIVVDGGFTFKVSAQGASAGIMVGYNSTPFAICAARRASAPAPANAREIFPQAQECRGTSRREMSSRAETLRVRQTIRIHQLQEHRRAPAFGSSARPWPLSAFVMASTKSASAKLLCGRGPIHPAAGAKPPRPSSRIPGSSLGCAFAIHEPRAGQFFARGGDAHNPFAVVDVLISSAPARHALESPPRTDPD